MGPLAFMVANLLGARDFKAILRKEGKKLARRRLEALWRTRVEPAIPSIAADIERDGFTWDGHGGTGTPDEGEGRGFILCRDALYRIIRQTGVAGGWARDGWRDGADNAVWAAIKDRVFKGETTLLDIVRLTFEALIEHTL